MNCWYKKNSLKSKREIKLKGEKTPKYYYISLFIKYFNIKSNFIMQ